MYTLPFLKNIWSFTIMAMTFTLFSCGSSTPVTTSAEPSDVQILNEEIRRFDNAGEIHIENTYYNPHIKAFLTAYSNGDRVATDQLKNTLTEPEISKILNEEEIKYLLKQLEAPSAVPYTSFMASHKVVLEDLHDRDDKNAKNNERIKNIDKDRMIISTPIYTRDKQYAMVDVSKGKLNSMYTTINLYQKEGDTYVFYKTLRGYME